MIARASGLGTGVLRYSRPLRGVGVLAMSGYGTGYNAMRLVCL